MTTFIKDPDARLDYTRDWSDWLALVDDTIESSEWIVPEGITGNDMSHTDTSTTIWLQGGATGQKYDVTNRIVTAGGRTDDRTFTVQIRER